MNGDSNKRDCVNYICKQYQKYGECSYGDSCKFLHETNSSTPIKENTLEKRVRTKRKGNASSYLRNFLVETFGLETLRSGSGILDIAGGKGQLSFELLNVNCCQSTIFDPRDKISYDCYIKKLQSGNYFSFNESLNKFERNHQNQAQPLIPSHIKIFWTPILWETIGLEVKNEEYYVRERNYFSEYTEFLELSSNENFDRESHLTMLFKEAANCWNPKTLLTQGSATPASEESIDIKSTTEMKELLENCSFVVGLHPDQATEAIVDFCLLFNKPFAVVPCCVCSKQFTRRTLNGNLVRNYEQLIAHLLSKNDKIKVAVLPISGRNQVLYWSPTF